MSRSANMLGLGGYGSTSPNLNGLAIITENKALKSLDNIPGISIDDSFLSAGNEWSPSRKQQGAKSRSNQTNRQIKIPPASLCGARIAVYRHTVVGRAKKRSIATIGGIFRIGRRHFALTAAHVFFDNELSVGSWADSGLYVTNSNGSGLNHDLSTPKISETYEIVIESYWPNTADPYAHSRPTNVSIGLVAPSLLHRRKGPESTALPEVIWDEQHDWALIELSDTAFWQVNKLQVAPGTTLEVKPPPFDQGPPMGEVIVAAGTSGAVLGMGLDSVERVKLPWSSSETRVWIIMAETAIGDCGATVVDSETGVMCGMVVSSDPETGKTNIIPAPEIFEGILGRYSEELLTLDDMFSIKNTTLLMATSRANKQPGEYSRTPVVRSADTNVMNIFMSTLKGFSLQSFDGRRFVRRNALVQWLLSARRDGIPNIDFMLDDAYPRNAMLPITSGQISDGQETCLVVFCMLFELGRGNLIHHFMRQGLTDNRLPFDLSLLNETADRIDLPEDDNLAREFYDNQWAYCPVNFDLEMERDVPPHVVIPIHQRQQINSKGGTATLWQITVLEEFVGKRLQSVSSKARFNDPADKLGYRYKFAIKSFAKHQSNFFDSEVTAFKAFRTIPGMIGYLGNYSYTVKRPNRRAPSFSIFEDKRQDVGATETNNILLEYGDFDLDEYFAATQPPVLPIQVTQFWQDISAIAEAISEIHSFSTSRAGVTQEYAGWHADIKPDNILNVKGGFKLADPGFARFERSEKKLTRLVGGTRTFGSPEAHSTQRFQDHPVSQAIDIWSLGCVLSVAATWVTLGWPGVIQFQHLRVEALKRLAYRIPGRRPSRNRSRNRSRNQSRNRSAARTSGLSIESVSGISVPEGDCFHNGANILEEVLHWHNFLRSVVRKSDQVTAQMLDLIDERMLQTNPEDRIEAHELYRQMRVIVHSSEMADDNSPADIVSQILLRTSDRGITEGPRLSALTLSSARTDIESQSPKINNASLSPHMLSPRPPLSRRVTGSTSSTLEEEEDAIGDEILEKQQIPQFRNIVLNELGGRSVSDSIDIPIAPPRTMTMKVPGLQHARRMSVSEARAEVDKKKGLFSRRKKDPFLMKHLENRDIEFLVDNGDTMAKHWSEMKDLLQILCSMVSDVDKDGFDLSFTSGTVRLKQQSSAKAVKSTMDNHRAKPMSGSRTDMSEAMDQVLNQYFSKVKSKSHKSSSKNYTLIVLTDGIWRGMESAHAVEDTIIRFMNELARHRGDRLHSRAVTIQFIQFGDDEEATNRLQMLDRGLIDYEIPDVIDTEPSDGNVLKMLLGSVDASFDYADSGA